MFNIDFLFAKEKLKLLYKYLIISNRTSVSRLVFDRVYLAIQLLGNATQQVYEIFRMITSNIYQSIGPHQSASQSSTTVQSSLSSSINQNTKVPFFYRTLPGSLHSTP